MKARIRPFSLHSSAVNRRPAHKSGSTSEAIESLGITERDLSQDRRVPVLLSVPDGTDKELQSCADAAGINKDHRYDLPLVNGFSAYLDPTQVEQLAQHLPKGAHLNLNKPIHYPDPHQVLTMMSTEDPAKPRITRLPGLHKVWADGYTGKGETVAVIDSGIYPHPDLKGKVVKWVDFSDGKSPTPVDPFGHGTNVAGIIAGDGKESHGKVEGVAPDAKLVGLRITTVAEAIRALQWCIKNRKKYNIKVVNMSLGDYAYKGYKHDPWAQATQKAIDAGLVVVVAAGNEGPRPKTISTPGILPDAITVGAYDGKGTPTTKDDRVASFSSRGPTVDGLHKPDVVAPGVGIYGPLSPGSKLDVPDLPHIGKEYIALSGTSQATPMISGLAALMLQANPKLKQADILKILRMSAVKDPTDGPDAQGAGLVHADKAIELAKTWPEKTLSAAA